MNLPAAYLDTSALVSLFVDEGRGDEPRLLVAGVTALHASRLVLTEARVTLARMNRGGRLDLPAYQAALRGIQDFWESDLISVPLSEGIHQDAESLAQAHQLRSADALHLATALSVRRSLPKGLPVGFVGYDHDLQKAAEALRFVALPSLSS